MLIKFVLKRKKQGPSLDNIDLTGSIVNLNAPNKTLRYGVIFGIILWVIDLISGFGA